MVNFIVIQTGQLERMRARPPDGRKAEVEDVIPVLRRG